MPSTRMRIGFDQALIVTSNFAFWQEPICKRLAKTAQFSLTTVRNLKQAGQTPAGSLRQLIDHGLHGGWAPLLLCYPDFGDARKNAAQAGDISGKEARPARSGRREIESGHNAIVVRRLASMPKTRRIGECGDGRTRAGPGKHRPEQTRVVAEEQQPPANGECQAGKPVELFDRVRS